MLDKPLHGAFDSLQCALIPVVQSSLPVGRIRQGMRQGNSALHLAELHYPASTTLEESPSRKTCPWQSMLCQGRKVEAVAVSRSLLSAIRFVAIASLATIPLGEICGSALSSSPLPEISSQDADWWTSQGYETSSPPTDKPSDGSWINLALPQGQANFLLKGAKGTVYGVKDVSSMSDGRSIVVVHEYSDDVELNIAQRMVNDIMLGWYLYLYHRTFSLSAISSVGQ